MKKLLVAGMVAGLLVGSVVSAEAKKKPKPKPKPKAPVATDMKYFLTDPDQCRTQDNTLSLTDNAEPGCWYVDSGLLYEAFVSGGLLTVDDVAVKWAAVDGVPFTLDATRHITGEVTTEGGACAAGDPAPCSPVTLSAGNVALDVIVRGEIGGETVELGTFTETFQSLPGTSHTSKVDITLDAAFDKQLVTGVTVLTYLHGEALFHGTVELEDPSSFVSIPAL